MEWWGRFGFEAIQHWYVSFDTVHFCILPSSRACSAIGVQPGDAKL